MSLATYLVFPDKFIRFGILHCIAVSSLIGLVVLRLPEMLIFALALTVLAMPHALMSDTFNWGFLLWVGLSTATPPALDYIPILPWTAWFLVGLACAKLLRLNVATSDQSDRKPVSPFQTQLAWSGKHSLTIYLLHQPILLGLIWSVKTLST